MEYRNPPYVSRSHLLRMVALSQRAVDFATKAYELQDSRFSRPLQHTERRLRDLQIQVARRGQNLREAGTALDDDSVPGSCTLRIYSGLQITFAAAREIAQNALLPGERRPFAGPSSPRSQHAARFVNSLVTLNAIALLNRQARFAEAVSQARQHPGWPLALASSAHEEGPSVDTHAAWEGCIVRCLCAIADQAVDIACATVRWLGSESCDRAGELAACRGRIRPEREMPTLRCTDAN